MRKPRAYAGCNRDHEHLAAGMLYRPGSGDLGVLQELCYGQWAKLFEVLQKDDVCLDLGSNVGTLAYAVAQLGIRDVVCVEPAGDAVEVLRQNVPWADIVEAAVVGDGCKTKTVTLFKFARSSWLNSLVHKGNSQHRLLQGEPTSIQVPAIRFSKVLAKKPFTVLVIDVEGAEYAFLGHKPLPATVQVVSLEYHFYVDQVAASHDEAQRLNQWFVSQGFVPLAMASHCHRGVATEDSESARMVLYVRGRNGVPEASL